MIKSRKNTKKRLHKGKKIMAKKPLFSAVEHGSTTGTAAATGNGPYLQFNLTGSGISGR